MLSPLFVLALLFFWLPSSQPPAAPAQPSATSTQPSATPAQPPPASAKPTVTPSKQHAAPGKPTIPADAVNMVNPVTPTPASQAKAKTIYGYDCAMCHAANGNGKGDVAGDMKLTMKNYTDPAALKGMTDGELFYIIKNGEGKMPGEDGRATPGDMWNMVILIRSFSKQ